MLLKIENVQKPARSQGRSIQLNITPLLTCGLLQRSDSFDGHCDGVSAAKAECGDSPFSVASFHFVEQSCQHASAGVSDRMAESDCTTVNVDLFHFQAEFF